MASAAAQARIDELAASSDPADQAPCSRDRRRLTAWWLNETTTITLLPFSDLTRDSPTRMTNSRPP
jgi:hypothetical protein